MNGLRQDFRYALRQVRKNLGFAVIAIITLALGIGANSAIFSVVSGVLLRPLPLKDSDRLVRIWHVPPQTSFPGMTEFAVSPANYLDWQKQNNVLEDMTIYTYRPFTFTGGDKAEQVDAGAVSPDFFSTLGVQPLFGRTLTPEEEQQGRSHVVVLSYRFWQDHFGSNRDIVGHDIQLDGQPYLIAGVMPASFRQPDFAQMWTPTAWTSQESAVRGNHNYMVIGRLKPGVSVKQAQTEMNTISKRLEQQYPEDDKGWGAIMLPLRDDLVGDVKPSLLVLLGAVAFILLIACVNVANLSLSRTLARKKEVAIRTALGASTARLVRQVMTESVLLALIGGLLGLAYAPFGVRLITAFLADKLPRSSEVGLDLSVLAFTAGISILTGIIAGILPAFRLARADVSQSLKQGLGRTDSDSSNHKTHNVLVVAEVSLSLVLLVGAGLMVRSFQQLRDVNPGFDTRGLLTMTAGVSRAKFPTAQQQVSYFERVLERVRGVPGVQSAGVVDNAPLDGGGSHQPIQIEGHPVVPMADQPEVDVRLASAGYVEAIHVPLLRGRAFNSGDIAGRPPVILISTSLARQCWPGEDPIGKHITLTFFRGVAREVVGVVGDVKLDSLDQARPSAALYVPLDQVTAPANEKWQSFPMTLVVRTAVDPKSVVNVVTSAVHEADNQVPLRDVLTMEDLVTQSVSPQRLNMILLGAFSSLALVLAAIGIYSVLSYSVRRRVQEIGIRFALGASLGDVLRMVVLEGMKPTILGVAIGVAGALALGRVVSSLVFAVKPWDPLTFLAVAVLLALVAFCATLIPAWRASKVDPMVALRYE